MQTRPLRVFAGENLIKTLLLLTALALIVLFFPGIVLSTLRIFFGAGFLAFLLSPIVQLFEKKFKRPLSALLVLLIAAFLLLLCLVWLVPAAIEQISALIELLPDAFLRVKKLADGAITWIRSRVPDITLPQLDFSGMENGFSGIAKETVHYAGNFFEKIYELSLMVVLSYFLMADRTRVLLRMELFIPASWRKTVVRMGNGIVRELRLYLRGQATIALAVGILASIALFIIGVRGALLLGLIVGLFNMIPYFGPILGSIPAVIMALSLSWQKAILTVLAMFLVQQVDGLVISPRIMGSITGFSPGVVLLALFLGSKIGGVLGMLLAMPVLMSIRTVYRVFVQRNENN